MKYTIRISELLKHDITIEADNLTGAIEKVKNKYYDSEIVLTADDYVDGSVEFDLIKQERG